MPTLLITGANRGLGLEFTRSYAAEGWHVHACCRHPEKAGDLKALAGSISLHRLDVTDGLRVASLARELIDQPIDLLLANAGVYGPRTGFGDTDYDAWAEVLQTNTLAPLRLAERFVEHIATSERKQFVAISSIMGSLSENASGDAYVYRSSKAALNMVVKSLSIDLRSRGVTVLALHPGWVRTDMGGAEASVTPQDSVAGMRRVIDAAALEASGGFFDHNGARIAW